MKNRNIILALITTAMAALLSLNFIPEGYSAGASLKNSTENSNLAPEIKAEKWINSSRELTLKDLRGKVVLIEFWTFGCYNCTNTIPRLNEWYKEYKSGSFEIIGIHCPEFDYERDFENVKENVKELGIEYPVAIDNAFYNWYNYDVHAWPTIFLIDKKGKISYQKVGEGSYRKTEEKIKELLKEEA